MNMAKVDTDQRRKNVLLRRSFQITIISLLLRNTQATTSSETKQDNLSLISDLTWPEITAGVKIRFFSPDKNYTDVPVSKIWGMGEDITCDLDNQGNVQNLSTPNNFNESLQIKLFTHGFNDHVENENDRICEANNTEVTLDPKRWSCKDRFVQAWMEAFDNKVSVILVDWMALAHVGDIVQTLLHYDKVAKNSIDVGNYLGRCLAKLSDEKGVKGEEIHLAGHSLGAHLVGKAGRTFSSMKIDLKKIGRITGLDPAGPRFVDGCRVQIAVLNKNLLSRDSADFVDIIHANGALRPCAPEVIFGLQTPLGHYDFYPSVTEEAQRQFGCRDWDLDMVQEFGRCSHTRAWQYYLHSITQPRIELSTKLREVSQCLQKAPTWPFYLPY